MRPWQIKKSAEEFGISLQSAINMRLRFLVQHMAECERYMQHGGNVPEIGFDDAFDEIVELHWYFKNSQKVHKKEMITDEMIAQAKATPIETVVTFDRNGKALAFCHADKSPSLSWNRKGNRAHCFPCAKSFNAVDVLMVRDNLTFIEAVKQLVI